MNDKKTDKCETSTDDKIKVNFYLSPKTLEKLDDLLFYVKKRLPIEKRRKLNKSVFYEICFQIIIEDNNFRGEESSFWKSIHKLMQGN
jgi:hypothetical protein